MGRMGRGGGFTESGGETGGGGGGGGGCGEWDREKGGKGRLLEENLSKKGGGRGCVTKDIQESYPHARRPVERGTW